MTARVGACAIALAVVPAWRAAPQITPAPDVTTLVASLKSSDAVEPLLGALKDRDPEVRRQAAWAIGVLAK